MNALEREYYDALQTHRFGAPLRAGNTDIKSISMDESPSGVHSFTLNPSGTVYRFEEPTGAPKKHLELVDIDGRTPHHETLPGALAECLHSCGYRLHSLNGIQDTDSNIRSLDDLTTTEL